MQGSQHGHGDHLGRLAGGLDGHVGGEVASLEEGVTWGAWEGLGLMAQWAG